MIGSGAMRWTCVALSLLAACQGRSVVVGVEPRRPPAIEPLRASFAEVTSSLSDPVTITLASPHDFAFGAVAAGDFDGDGDVDLVTTRTDTQPPAFLVNEGGRFRDRAEAWGLGALQRTLSLGAADFDGDGRLDLVVTTVFPASLALYRNAGGSFVPSGFSAGPFPLELIPTVLPEDLDRDGLLDLLVGGMSAPGRCRVDTPGTCRDNVQMHAYRQTAPFVFEPAEILARPGRAVAMAMVDWDHDGRDEVLVAADQGLFSGGNQLLRVEPGAGGVGFRLREVTMGTALDVPMAGMGVARIDVDEDGTDEVLITNFGRNLLVRNDRGVARDVTAMFGAGSYGFEVPGQWPTFRSLDDENPAERALYHFRRRFLDQDTPLFIGTKWTALAFDFDGDTHQDVYQAAGAVGVDDILPEAPLQRGIMLRGGGWRLTDVSAEVGFRAPLNHIAAVAADLDDDGDLDLALLRLAFRGIEGGLSLWRNDATGARFLRVRGRAAGRNLQAIGAAVEVRVGERVMRRRIEGATSCFGYGPNEAHFGLGQAAVADRVTVRFPSGRTVVREHVPAGTVEVSEE